MTGQSSEYLKPADILGKLTIDNYFAEKYLNRAMAVFEDNSIFNEQIMVNEISIPIMLGE